MSPTSSQTTKNSDIDDLKALLRSKMLERDGIEKEINEVLSRLNVPGGPGMDGSLLDKEGYPLAGLDILSVRIDRTRVICLTNDHKALSTEISGLLPRLHELSRQAPVIQEHAPSAPAASRISTSAGPSTTAAAEHVPSAKEDERPLYPFILVDEVSPCSPAAEAGLCVGDRVLRFGSVMRTAAGARGELAAMAALVQESQGSEVEVEVLRNGSTLRLHLTPHTWSGRGLLGCHLQPLE